MDGDFRPTRYPVILVHGINVRDGRSHFYWGRIPEALRENGVRVYLGGQDAWGTVAGNASQLKETVLRALEENQCGKVNFIAHSKGGLDVRYLVSRSGMAAHTASVTTLSTPHRGSHTAKWMAEQRLLSPYGACSNRFWGLLGDEAPRFRESMRELSAEGSEAFNRQCPDRPGVFYQSWGARLAGSRHDPLMAAFAAVCRPLDGETDGMVSPASAEWGLYRGTLERVSHHDLVDAARRDLPHFRPCDFYLRIVRELAGQGF